LAITSPTSGGRSVGIVRSRTQTMEFSFFSVRLTLSYPNTCLIIARAHVSKFDGHLLWDPSRNRVRPDTRLQIKECNNQHVPRPSSYVQFCTLTLEVCTTVATLYSSVQRHVNLDDSKNKIVKLESSAEPEMKEIISN
jgi:hypothetical protein